MARRTKTIVFAAVVLMVGAGIAVAQMLRYGFSAKDDPSAIEAAVARAARRYAAPVDLRDRKNPVQLTPAVMAEARAHFADHCAACHGNDGKGQTEMGGNFYPKVPDMTLRETQSQSDGELFATIENGIRLSGMPAWGNGTAASAYGSWTLVHFIRHLPQLTTAEIEDMKAVNPKSKEEWEAQAEADEFLQGSDESEPAMPRTGHSHH